MQGRTAACPGVPKRRGCASSQAPALAAVTLRVRVGLASPSLRAQAGPGPGPPGSRLEHQRGDPRLMAVHQAWKLGGWWGQRPLHRAS